MMKGALIIWMLRRGITHSIRAHSLSKFWRENLLSWLMSSAFIVAMRMSFTMREPSVIQVSDDPPTAPSSSSLKKKIKSIIITDKYCMEHVKFHTSLQNPEISVKNIIGCAPGHIICWYSISMFNFDKVAYLSFSLAYMLIYSHFILHYLYLFATKVSV